MNDGDGEKPDIPEVDHARRKFLRGTGKLAVGAAAGGATAAKPAWGGSTFMEALGDFFQSHYQRMQPEEIESALRRIEAKAKRRFGVDITCENTPPQQGVVFGYAINIS